MKVLAILLVCAVAAVQGRSAVQVVKSNGKSLANLGDAPWVVHLRRAVSTSGLLESSAGALISSRWALTSAGAVQDARFIWVRYGTVTVINPELVTETSAVRLHPHIDLALVSLNRDFETTSNIATVSLGRAISFNDEAVQLYTYGDNGADGPGEALTVWSATLSEADGAIIATSDAGSATKFDLGAPLVVDSQLVGVLVAPGDGEIAAKFLPTADAVEWIESETGLEL